jgi:hypothetical protein
VSTTTAVERDDDDGDGDGDDVPVEPEKIEVHVHVHRGENGQGETNAARRKRKPRSLALTGTLFDWKQHYDQVCKRPPPSAPGGPGAARARNCASCGAEVARFARTCRRCEAPQPQGVVTKIAIALGLTSVVGVFALSAALLGESSREHRPPEPLRSDFTIDEAYVIEVAPPPSPFHNEASSSGLTSGATMRSNGN